MKPLENLLKIQKINKFNDEVFTPAHLKILHNEKGKAVFLNSTESIGTVAFLEFIPNTGIRGNHYHLKKREIMYIIEGKITVYYWLPQESKIDEVIVEAGDLLTFEPGLAHAYKALEQTFAIEMGSILYDPDDTIFDKRIS